MSGLLIGFGNQRINEPRDGGMPFPGHAEGFGGVFRGEVDIGFQSTFRPPAGSPCGGPFGRGHSVGALGPRHGLADQLLPLGEQLLATPQDVKGHVHEGFAVKGASLIGVASGTGEVVEVGVSGIVFGASHGGVSVRHDVDIRRDADPVKARGALRPEKPAEEEVA